jgi:excisionase family DNA binding protein
MWQRFTERARRIVFLAQEEAVKRGGYLVSTEHLLLGILREPEAVSGLMLERLGVSLEKIQEELEPQIQPDAEEPLRTAAPIRHSGKSSPDPQLSPRGKQVVDLAYDEARQLNNNYIGSEHLLLGLIREGEGLAGQVLARLGVTLERARAEIENPLLTLDEAARFLNVSKPTLYRMLNQGDLQGLKAGRQWRFSKFDLMRYMKRGPVAVAAAPVEVLEPELSYFRNELQQAGAAVPEEREEIVDEGERKIAHLMDCIGRLAIHMRASDIHLEPVKQSGESYLLLRFRVDGRLQEIRRLPLTMHEVLLLGVKQLTGMEMNERKLPQNGRLLVTHADKEFDLMISTIPTLFGEALTVRILDRSHILIDLEKLGILPDSPLSQWIHRPNGLILVSGPSGSGKDTLLYSCVHAIASPDRKTMTVEESVDYLLPHTTPIEANKKVGLTVAAALRAIWRQDPDVLMIRGIEDGESAHLAAEFALTGHLVLGTLHAHGAAETVRRLLDMEVEPLLLSRTLAGVVSLRLAAKICSDCKEPAPASLSESTLAHIRDLAAAGGYEMPEEVTFSRGKGCEACRNRGYRGRIALYEFLSCSQALGDAILNRGSAEEFAHIAVRDGMQTLLADGIRKAVEGQTTLDEVLRAGILFL